MALRMIDLSQEIYQGMTTFPMHQPTFIMTNMTHEENMRKTGSKTLGFSARNLLLSEHCGTHTDAVWEYEPSGPSIDRMPMEYFWGSAVCADVSDVPASRFIEREDLETAVKNSGQEIRKGDIFLMYTGHYDKNFDTDLYQTVYSGLSYETERVQS